MIVSGLATRELLPHQIKQIERALADVGELPMPHSALRSGWAAWRGEVRLIKAKGKLRLPMSPPKAGWAAGRIQRVISEEALTPAETQEARDARADTCTH